MMRYLVKRGLPAIGGLTETLEEALKPGYAFFIQPHPEEYGHAKPEEEDAER